jgi:hypothetical protein
MNIKASEVYKWTYFENTVKPVLNGISRDQNIFPLKPGFRLIKVYYNNLISQGTWKYFHLRQISV